MIKGHAPGSILQYIFIRNRLGKLFRQKSTFIEVGSGNGHLSNLLLSSGYEGTGVDLNASACENNKTLNAKAISAGKYKVLHNDFAEVHGGPYDFLISSMVIEHIPDEALMKFIEKAKAMVKDGGTMVFLVPSNMKAWGIEDEIAGHVKRYSFAEINALAEKAGLSVEMRAGLNYPLSNWLLSLSNRLVKRHEGHMNNKTDLEKTVYTGNRSVKYKTVFPAYLNVVLNEVVLWPFHLLQLLNRNNESSLIMYFELKKK